MNFSNYKAVEIQSTELKNPNLRHTFIRLLLNKFNVSHLIEYAEEKETTVEVIIVFPNGDLRSDSLTFTPLINNNDFTMYFSETNMHFTVDRSFVKRIVKGLQ